MSEMIKDFEVTVERVDHNKKHVVQEIKRKYADQVKGFSEVNVWQSYMALSFDWMLVGTTICLSELWFNPLIYMLSIFLIAGRQHAILVLVHDAAHFRLSKSSKLNDFISDFFAAYPALFDTHAYRLHHAKHHRYTNTEQDPDWVRKQGRAEWTFPLDKTFIAKTYPKFIFWTGPVEWITLSLYFSGILPLKTILKAPQRSHFLKRVVYYSVLAIILSSTGTWKQYLLYWIVPLLFVFPSFQRVRSVAEHFGLSREHELNSSRNVIAPWYERLFFAPHGVNYHLTHHMFPAVPFFRLKELNALLMKDERYKQLAHQNTSYVVPSAKALFKDLLKSDEKATISKVPQAS